MSVTTRLAVRCFAFAVVVLMVSALSVGAQRGSTVANPTSRLIKVPITGNPMRSFDISWVDSATGKYYLGDRSNASIDVIDVATNALVAQIGGFVGFKGTNDTSGPDGVVVTISGKELWAGDGDSTVKVVDLASGKVAASVSTGGKKRADELAYDPEHQLILAGNNADDPAFVSFISVGARQMLKKIEYPDADDGIEQPWYDFDTHMFYLAVPGTSANPGGEVDVLDPVSMSVTARYGFTNCTPHGLTSGPAGTNQMLAGCNKPNRTVIFDKTNGKVLADFNNVGGADEVWFNSGENRYYTASSSAQMLGIIDATTMSFVENVETGLNAHSVAADSVSNHVFVPIGAPDPACPTGCVAVFASVKGDKPRK